MYYPPSGTYSDSYAKDMVIVRTRLQWVLLVGFLALLFAFPLSPFASEDILRVLVHLAIIIIAVHGINIVTGYCGQITLGQAAFVLIGGYVSGIMSNEVLGPALAGTGWEWLQFWIAMPVAVIATVILGLLFALPTARVKELYLALVTFAAHFIILWALRWVPYMMGGRFQSWGAAGIPLPAPAIGSFVIEGGFRFYYLAMIFVIIMTLFAKGIARSGLGRAFVAIRDNDIAAEAIGINIFRYKLIAFAICSAYAGVAGSLFGHFLGFISIESQTFMNAVWYVGMIIVGGMGTIIGPIFGSTVIEVLHQIIVRLGPQLEGLGPLKLGSGGGILIFALGLVIVLFLIFEPRGMAHRWNIIKGQIRLWPFAY